MELTQKINCLTRASATLEEDGRLSLKVFAQAEYAKGKTCTAEVVGDEIDPKLVDAANAALKAVLDASAGKLGNRIAYAILKSAEVAAAHGEI